jgi:hypothetical protein
MANLLEPWVLLRVVAGLVATLLFARAAWTSLLVLRKFDVNRATEGQLVLERRLELASTFVRVASVVQVLALALFMLAADRLSHAVRGAMCAYGVFNANEWGFRALYASIGVALAAGIVTQLFAFDARVRGMDLARVLAVSTLVLAPLSALDFALVTTFFTKLDLSVVASCCSVQLDAEAAGFGAGMAHGPRVLTAILAPIAIALSIGVALLAARKPTAGRAAVCGALSLATLPIALAASVLEVAPHAFEVPQHVCPFCLLKADVLGLGYPLFGAIFLAVVWSAGAALSGLVARGPAARAAFAAFARDRLRREVWAWAIALALGIAPVARYAIVAGAPLFHGAP